MHVNMQGDGTRNLEFYAMLSQEVPGTERKPDVEKTPIEVISLLASCVSRLALVCLELRCFSLKFSVLLKS
jgi:hypothetical protein